ncbi:tRNA pseudouridine(38-40) synthase TruA [Leekyejoonella antrihumi]|uniref:tRNA pseudouridine synthase A n=1 Tax=Leekyejoonella antrihumi TaxID=1660198 RepID=A0A563E4G1_9MICO|nr:tRNA pseudouridine(38-40) synthase TruA [Leekyejoonella antrihumi]TWP37396.1 tRNA pseudouridine(38-40) synthase TruA [Leekyejoonella antrihumi]
MRLRIDFAYDGTDFSGWAAQPGRRTVEQLLSEGLGTILRLPQPPRVTVAGRTDAGVHANGAVCHVDVDDQAYAALPGRSDHTADEAARARLTGVLPRDIVVHRVAVAPPGFDARFSAVRRRYRYRLLDDPALADPLRRRDTVIVRRALDVERMNLAARTLVGLKDFAAFCKKRDGATTVRTLLEYTWRRMDDGVVEGTVVADAFCHSMVRALVGAVVPVGDGRRPAQWPVQVLTGARRHPAVTVMPPHGLSLMEVTYPPDDQLAARAHESRTVRTLGVPPNPPG